MKKISSKAYNTRVNCNACFRNFDDFCKSQFDTSMDTVIDDINFITDSKKQKMQSLDVLQDFVNHMHGIGINPSTIRVYFTHIKKFFRWQGFDIDSDDIKDCIDFPKPLKEESIPLTEEHIKKILDHANLEHRTLYLLLSSSGIRIAEALSLRKRDFDLNSKRIKITIPAIHTKTKQERYTFVSKECDTNLRKMIGKVKPDDFVFIKYSPTPIKGDLTVLERKKVERENFSMEIIKAKNTQEKYFERIREKAGFTERKESRVNKITLHSFRSWFITKCDKVDFGMGHSLAGHGFYMNRYNRYTSNEMLDFYLKAEPDLQIFERPDNENEKIVELEKQLNDFKIESEEKIGRLQWENQTKINGIQTKQNLANDVLLKLVNDDEFKGLLEKYTMNKN